MRSPAREGGHRSRRPAAGRPALRPALLCAALAAAAASPAAADDTLTLPRGVARVRVRPIVSFFSERWDQDARAEAVVHDLDGRQLDSEVFPDLAKLERLYTYRARSLSLGVSRVQSKVQVLVVAVAAEYGITDRLTVGAVVPVINARHNLRTLELEPVRTCDDQRCGMGLNPGDTSVTKEDSKYLPLDHDKDPSTRMLQPLSKDDVQQILVDDLGYERLGSWSGTAVGDVELGFKYRLHTARHWATSVQAGLRLPTGEQASPDNLLAFDLGDGQTDLGFYWQTDFTPIDPLRLNVTLRYTVQLPDFRQRRVPARADLPLTKPENSEEVWRDLGDVFGVDVTASYALWGGIVQPFAGYAFVAKASDDVRGNKGLTYQALMDETALQNHQLEAGIALSTVPWVLRKRFSVPLVLTASYARSVAGKDNAPISNTVSLELAGMFKVL